MATKKVHRNSGKIRKPHVNKVPDFADYILAWGFAIAVGKMNYREMRENSHREPL